MVGKPRTILNKKYTTLGSIDEIFGVINDLLNNKMDKVMLIFKDTNGDFYNEYKRARVIVDM